MDSVVLVKEETDRSMGQKESSEQRPHEISPTGLGQRSKGNTLEKGTKTVFAANGAGTQGVNVPKMNPDTGLQALHKFISKWIFDHKCKTQETPGRQHRGENPDGQVIHLDITAQGQPLERKN